MQKNVGFTEIIVNCLNYSVNQKHYKICNALSKGTANIT